MKCASTRNEIEAARLTIIPGRGTKRSALAALASLAALAGVAGCVEPEGAEEPFEAPLQKPGDDSGVPPQGAPEDPPQVAVPSFDLTVPVETFLVQGSSISHAIGVSAIEGFTGAVELSATSVYPLGLTLTPSTVTAPGSASLAISAPCNWPAMMREVIVAGTSGAISKSKALAVRVFPFGSFDATRGSVHVPRAIPDNHPNGATSTLLFSETENILHMVVEPRITHPRPADLVVNLVSPSGATVILHNRAAVLQPSYAVFAFNGGTPLGGDWKLRVVDWVTGVTGTIDGWTLRAMVRGLPPPPVAAFSASVNGLAATFTETSTDPQACGGSSNGEIVSWSWAFGDGSTSTARYPSHTYAAPGLYEVTLTVTNGSDIAAQASQRLTIAEGTREEPTEPTELVAPAGF